MYVCVCVFIAGCGGVEAANVSQYDSHTTGSVGYYEGVCQ